MVVQPTARFVLDLVGNPKDRFSHDAVQSNILPVVLYCNFVSQEQSNSTTVMILIFQTDRSGQTEQTQIRLLLEEQSDQGLHCLLFHLHLFDEIPLGLASLFEF